MSERMNSGTYRALAYDLEPVYQLLHTAQYIAEAATSR